MEHPKTYYSRAIFSSPDPHPQTFLYVNMWNCENRIILIVYTISSRQIYTGLKCWIGWTKNLLYATISLNSLYYKIYVKRAMQIVKLNHFIKLVLRGRKTSLSNIGVNPSPQYRVQHNLYFIVALLKIH